MAERCLRQMKKGVRQEAESLSGAQPLSHSVGTSRPLPRVNSLLRDGNQVPQIVGEDDSRGRQAEIRVWCIAGLEYFLQLHVPW